MKVCAKCGKDHVDRNGRPTCAGHKMNVRPWEPCKAYPPPGARVCKMHGANAGRKGRAHTVALRLARAQREAALAEMATYGEMKPHRLAEGILEEIFWTKGHLDFLRSKVRETNPDQLVWGTTEHVESTEDVKTKEVAAPSVWLKLYQEERRIYMELVKNAHAMGIEERRVAIAERMGDQLLRFADHLASQIRIALVEEGWVAEELEEVWHPVLDKVIPLALEASKEDRE